MRGTTAHRVTPAEGAVVRARLGVVIVHYHREAALAELLASLESAQQVPPTHIVVVDNGSEPELLAEVRRAHPAVRWTCLPNPGYGAAMNAGVRLLPDHLDLVALLTHEVRLENGCLRRLANVLLESEAIGLVGPLLLDADHEGRVWSLGGAHTSVRRLPFNVGRGEVVCQPLGERRVADWLDGSACLIRRADFADLGGFGEHYFLYFEDVDLGWRVRRLLGKRVVCYTPAVASQAPGGHLDQFLATRNLLWMFADNRAPVAWLLFLVESVARLIVGPLLRPRGGPDRVRRRYAGLVAGLRRPTRGRPSRTPGP